jgi:hypothetical protein
VLLRNVGFICENRDPITSGEFLLRMTAGKRFVRMMKEFKDGYSDVTMKLTTEEALELLDPDGKVVELVLGEKLRNGGAIVALWLDATIAAESAAVPYQGRTCRIPASAVFIAELSDAREAWKTSFNPEEL